MEHTLSLRCPEDSCTFTYSPHQHNALKTHKAKVHLLSVPVLYRLPFEEVVLERQGTTFKCVRCPFRTEYPNVIQKHAKSCQSKPLGTSASRVEHDSTPAPHSPSLSLSPSPSLSLLCSPEALPNIDTSEYTSIPDCHTVIHHHPYNLPALGIVVNTRFHCIICLNCERAVDCSNLIEHIHHELPLCEVPEDLPSDLQASYNLVPYSRVVYPSGPTPPIFGILLHPQPIFFCDCGKGYATFETLRTHQTRISERECPLRHKKPSYHQGYGQRLTANRPFFEVDCTAWRLACDTSHHYPLAFCQSLPPLRDYSKMEIKGAEDEMNTSSFFFTQRWLAHLDGYTPQDITEVTQESSPDASYGKLLRQVAEEFLMITNVELRNHNSFGILKLMGQTTERETLHRFDPVLPSTIKKYALTLHRLIFGVLRQLDPFYSHKYHYPPLHATQLSTLEELRAALAREAAMTELIPFFQAACYTLFAHHQHKYDTSQRLNQFFSPVICFLVLSSVREKGGFQLPSVITQYIAHIMFSIRAVIFFELRRKAEREKISLSEAYASFKEYLTSGHETPMAYYYNTVTLLATIRSDETNEARFSCTDDRGREFSYEGSLIRVNDITKMINALVDRYNAEMRQHCFFGQAVPDSLALEVNIGEIVDNLQNTQSGYSFIDDPRNPFLKYRSMYGEWLLSDPERAAHFAYIHEGRIVWKSRRCFALLLKMQEIRQTLLLLCIFSAGPSSRASEVARQLLRNVPGSLRNLLVLFHVVCLVDIQDKTSHKHLRDKYVPHCPTDAVSSLLIYNLAVFRPFEEYLVQIFLGDEHALRYHQQLWPGLKETISDTRVSDAIGKECSRYLVTPSSIGKVSYKILFWRNLVSAILKHQPDVRALATYQQYYIDTAMMHSTTMAVARYGGETSNLPMSDPRQVVECIKVGLAWHQLLNIGNDKSLRRDIDDQLQEIESAQARMFYEQYTSYSNADLELLESTVSTQSHLSSAAISRLANQLTDVVGMRLEGVIQETVMKAMAEMSHTYFPKVVPNLANDTLDISQIIIHPSRLQQLRTFLQNPLAQFTCPEQAVLLELMLLRRESILAILSTGSGKTFIILWQAALRKDLVTIVVLPLSTLHDDLKRRAFELGVSYSQWAPNGKYNPDVCVISVSIEHLGFPEFLKFMSDLEHHRRLGPLVFDEIHKMITDIEYRDAFQNFQGLHKVKAVIFGFSASIPPSLYPVLCELTGMTWRVLRTPSSRKELKYQVIAVPSDREMDQRIVDHLHERLASYRSQDRAMVFCRSKQHATTLASLLNIQPFYAPGDDANLLVQNQQLMIKWISGENKVMASTSILGCGIDYAHIRDVIHRDPSFSMLDQYQAESRGGRDGLECRATTFVVANKKYRIPEQLYDLGTKALFDSMNNISQCQRIAPSLYLDGRAVQCITLPGAIFCDFCEKSAREPESSSLSSNFMDRLLNSTRPVPDIQPAQISSLSHKAPPPQRSLDIFDPSPRIDLREYIRPVKRRTESLETTTLMSSPQTGTSSNKRVKFSDSSTLFTTSSSKPKPVVRTPASPTVERSFSKSRPPFVGNSSPTSNLAPRLRAVHPAGIQARQQHFAAEERTKEFDERVVNPLIQAVTFFRDKCIICWMFCRTGWKSHASDDCTRGIGTNYGDTEYKTFRSGAMRLPSGWCYSCLIHQKKMGHPFIPPSQCTWRGIVLRAIYTFTKLDIACPLIPSGLNIADTSEFGGWLSTDPGDFTGFPFHNGLKLFLWIIDLYNINDEY